MRTPLFAAASALALVACAEGGGGTERIGDPQQDSGVPGQDAGPDMQLPTDGPPQDLIPPIDQMVVPDACVPMVTELLVNPAFDNTPMGTGWTQSVVVAGDSIVTNTGFAAETAPYKAWHGGYSGEMLGLVTVTDSLYQDVAVPAMTTNLRLTGRFVVGTQEPNLTIAYDSASLSARQPNGTLIVTIRELDNTIVTGTAWQQIDHTFVQDLSGQTIRIFLTSTNDVFYPSNFFFDTLSLQATHGCP